MEVREKTSLKVVERRWTTEPTAGGRGRGRGGEGKGVWVWFEC